ncbi:hypothetical protein ACQKWADRAFT_140133 [Trichoderma austrokoningii]
MPLETNSRWLQVSRWSTCTSHNTTAARDGCGSGRSGAGALKTTSTTTSGIRNLKSGNSILHRRISSIYPCSATLYCSSSRYVAPCDKLGVKTSRYATSPHAAKIDIPAKMIGTDTELDVGLQMQMLPAHELRLIPHELLCSRWKIPRILAPADRYKFYRQCAGTYNTTSRHSPWSSHSDEEILGAANNCRHHCDSPSALLVLYAHFSA